MTPEETAAMAKRLEENRREATKKVVKEVKPPKTEKQAKGFVKIPVNAKKGEKPKKLAPKQVVKKANPPKPKSERIKPIGPATKKFKFKPLPKSRDVCDVLNCREKPKAGFRCIKHRKIIRKAQLAANNVVWKKRVKEGSAGHHAVYTYKDKQLATRYSLKATDKVESVVKAGHSIVPTVKKFKEIVVKTRALRASKKPAKKAA